MPLYLFSSSCKSFQVQNSLIQSENLLSLGALGSSKVLLEKKPLGEEAGQSLIDVGWTDNASIVICVSNYY